MRFLVLTLFGGEESRFYGRVTEELVRLGHEAAHVTWSPDAAIRLRRAGFAAYSLPDELDTALEPRDVQDERARLLATYDIPSLRHLYRTDPVCAGRSEAWCVERTIRHFLAL